MDHVSESWKCDELALRQLSMQVFRLTADIRNLIISTCDDRDWHLQFAVVVPQLHHGRSHEGGVLRRGA